MVARSFKIRFFDLNSLKMSHPTTPNSNHIARRLLFVLSMFFVSVAVAQRPLDRGIHKRSTGGYSFLFGHKKGGNHAISADESQVLQPKMPISLPTADSPVATLQAPSDGMAVAPVFKPRALGRVLRPLKKRKFGAIARVSTHDRALHRAARRPLNAAENDSEFDVVSVAAFSSTLLGILTYCLSWIVSVLPVSVLLSLFLMLLGSIMGIVGLSRTKKNGSRGRVLALLSILITAVPLAVWISLLLSIAIFGIF